MLALDVAMIIEGKAVAAVVVSGAVVGQQVERILELVKHARQFEGHELVNRRFKRRLRQQLLQATTYCASGV